MSRIQVQGSQLILTDEDRNQSWRVDYQGPVALGEDSTEFALAPALRSEGSRVRIELQGHCGTLELQLELGPDGFHVVPTRIPEGLMRIPLLPRVVEVGGIVVAPVYQGVLLRAEGEPVAARTTRGGHGGASMGMFGLLGSRGGMIVVPRRSTAWLFDWGAGNGSLWVGLDQYVDAGTGWEGTGLDVHWIDPDPFAAASRYRATLGSLPTWEDKIRERPILEEYFGALICFTGYVHDPDCDYVGNLRALQSLGFDRIFQYPYRFAHYSQDFTMAGGHNPVWWDEATCEAVEDLGGVYPSPWGWTFEGIDKGDPQLQAAYRRLKDGSVAGGWSMDGQHWRKVCTGYQGPAIRQWLERHGRSARWVHFDVNATVAGDPCYAPDHGWHQDRILGQDESQSLTAELFGREYIGNRMVSSEGFNDALVATQDVGSTKIVPLPGESPRFIPIPLTMMALHDVCHHDWWELSNYNSNLGWPPSMTHTGPNTYGLPGSGNAKLKAAMDALAGCPPNVFPFGSQYRWQDGPGGPTLPMHQRLDDPEVQAALAEALPVAKLHRRIGKMRMTGFRVLDESGLVQETTFADGTTITANTGPVAWAGLEAHSWSELGPTSGKSVK